MVPRIVICNKKKKKHEPKLKFYLFISITIGKNIVQDIMVYGIYMFIIRINTVNSQILKYTELHKLKKCVLNKNNYYLFYKNSKENEDNGKMICFYLDER